MTKQVLDLFAGLGGFSAAFEDADGWEVTTVDVEEEFDPDIVADVLDLRPTDFDPDFDVVLAGHPCTIFTAANLGHHLDEDGNPKTELARDHLAMFYHTIGLIRGLNPEWWFLENPRGRLRTVFERPEGTVWYCRYGEPYAKPTDLWGRHPPSFEYLSCSYDNDRCDHAKTESYREEGGGVGQQTRNSNGKRFGEAGEDTLRIVEVDFRRRLRTQIRTNVGRRFLLDDTLNREACGHLCMGKEPWEHAAEARRVERANFRTRKSDGYEILASTYQGKNERVYVHQLVAIADGTDPNDLFGGPIQIHHSNGVPWDNRPSNIETKHIAKHAADHEREKWGDRPWRDKDAMRDGLSQMSSARLADEWGCSRRTITNWRKRHGIEPGTPGRKYEKEERQQTD